MNLTEYDQWRMDAQDALSKRYTKEEVEKILEWFDQIRSSNERDLIGEERLEAYMIFQYYHKDWSLYNSLMTRLWAYAPFILQQK